MHGMLEVETINMPDMHMGGRGCLKIIQFWERDLNGISFKT